MRVCKEDLDNFDPWRLPAIQTENIALRFPRPDVSIAIGPVGGQQLITEPTNNPNRNSLFITQSREVATTAGKPGDLTINGGPAPYPDDVVPKIDTVSPNTGPLSGGTGVSVIGNNFVNITNVKLGGTNAVFTVVSPTQITLITPAYAVTGLVDLSILSTFGTATSHGAFKYT
jgi:hypothetical protein